MSNFDLSTVTKVANLARLELSDGEKTLFAGQMTGIMSLVNQLNEVDTATTEPLANVSDITLKMRDDVVNDGNQQQAVLQNAPDALEGFFAVPKIVE
jgi:aspartyl-tRNA(Asn)/glutamyl-tRNA(Gln) amidotransferase subunit C